jgi:aspartate aminotransferase-like enzyme
MPQAFGLNVVEAKVPWGTAVQPDQLLDVLKSNPETKAVYLVHSETSTGTATDVKEMARLIRANSHALVCVDGITAIGAHEMRFDVWGIDVCVTGSQKGLMIPPGLAFVALSQRAIEMMQTSRLPKFYFDLRKALKSYEKDDTPWTPAISLILGVDVALEMIKTEGIENVWKRHERLATALRAGIAAVGLNLFSDSPSYAVTSVWLPGGMDWKAFNRTLKLDNGNTIAGGQDEFAGKIFRVSHLGYYDDLDMVTFMAALERTLVAHGHQFLLGSGLNAVQSALLRTL